MRKLILAFIAIGVLVSNFAYAEDGFRFDNFRSLKKEYQSLPEKIWVFILVRLQDGKNGLEIKTINPETYYLSKDICEKTYKEDEHMFYPWGIPLCKEVTLSADYYDYDRAAALRWLENQEKKNGKK
jgi:transcriptional accessory protein Tex/SPT6